jgi:hypothetical protein
MFFEMTGSKKEGGVWSLPDGSRCCKFLFYVKDLVIPGHLEREAVLRDFREALTAAPGSPTFDYVKRDITVKFI